MRRAVRFGVGAVPVLIAAMLAVGAPGLDNKAKAQTAEILAIADDYEVQAVNVPIPTTAFGSGPLVNPGDLDGDGEDDVLVTSNPQGQVDGHVFAISGADGTLIYTLTSPDASPTPQPAGGEGSFFSQYMTAMPDFAGCAGGTPSVTCPENPIGGPDGTPEFAVGAIKVDVGGVVDLGRAYVFDGATGAVLKRIDMPAADRAHQASITPKVDPEFARTVLTPMGGFAAPPGTPPEVILGDMNAGGEPDLVVGTGTYYDTAASNELCDPGPCIQSGRTYVYAGEDIAGTDPNVILDTPMWTLKNPLPQTDDTSDPNTIGQQGENFGHSVNPIGDVGGCSDDAIPPGAFCPRASASNSPDGRPDVVVSAHRTDWPASWCFECGVVYLYDGRTGAILRRYEPPEPQPSVIWGFSIFNAPAIGHVGGTPLPDFYQPAVRQKVDFYAQGRGWLMNGDFKSGPNTVNIGLVDDPTPVAWSQFGTSSAGIGNVAGDPRNEILVAQWGSESGAAPNDAHVFDAFTGLPLHSFQDPDDQPGSGFGIGATSLGDLNDDGFMDFAFSSGGWDNTVPEPDVLGEGRLYIFRSTTAPAEAEREVTLRLRRHLRASGVVSVNGPAECAAGVPVVITRNGRTVKEVTTDATGAYRTRLADRRGTYRARATEVALDDVTCLEAISPKRTHSH